MPLLLLSGELRLLMVLPRCCCCCQASWVALVNFVSRTLNCEEEKKIKSNLLETAVRLTSYDPRLDNITVSFWEPAPLIEFGSVSTTQKKT